MNQTNYQRTAAWLKAAGKQPHNAEHLSVQLGVHLEEMREQLEHIKADNQNVNDYIAKAVECINYAAYEIKLGRALAYIPQHLRTDFLKELCDGKVTADGVAYMMGAAMDDADNNVLLANESKFNDDGTPVILEGGKIGKSKNYRKADLRGLV